MISYIIGSTIGFVGAGIARPPLCAHILFFLFLRKKRIAAASEEASSIPFPPGRRKLHIRSLLLPSQIVTVSLGHNLVSENSAAPHAILMMALRRQLADTQHSIKGGRPCPPLILVLLCSSAERRCAERRDLSGGRDWHNEQLITEIF